MDAWDSRFADRSPLLSSLSNVAPQLAGADWPDSNLLQQLLRDADVRTVSALPLQLVPVSAGSEPYELRLYRRGELEFRERNWHDLFNVLSWLRFPRAKAALNARHHAELLNTPVPGRRGPVRDALTLFDEDGVVVIAADGTLLGMIRDFQWKPLFWGRRADVIKGMRFLPFGHALCEKALNPYRGMTARGVLLEVDQAFFDLAPVAQLNDVDCALARRIADVAVLQGTRDLAPLPVLGVPGWHPGNECAGYYDDRDYFRPGRTDRSVPPRRDARTP
ncbi:MAG: DUF3025 domain-containing protein [Betaproteobacteria bacterium]|nr:DUF3025 domain-containing protein [Betaproteobacteria bacterium]